MQNSRAKVVASPKKGYKMFANLRKRVLRIVQSK